MVQVVSGRDFGQYLRFFSENLQMPSHKAALEKAFRNIQLEFNQMSASISIDNETLKEAIDEQPGTVVRQLLNISELREKAPNYPELMLTLAIYQAAHITYLSQLEAAIDRNQAITTEERDNAKSVIEHSLSQFGEFNIFGTLLPLILLQRQETTPAEISPLLGKYSWIRKYSERI